MIRIEMLTTMVERGYVSRETIGPEELPREARPGNATPGFRGPSGAHSGDVSRETFWKNRSPRGSELQVKPGFCGQLA